jgi:hypothetical protein
MPSPVLEVAPGAALGPFRLGDPLPRVLAILKARAADFPAVEVSAGAAAKGDGVALAIPDAGVRLLFDAATQRLRLAEAADLSRARVAAGPGAPPAGGSPAARPRFAQVHRAFGPTAAAEARPGGGAALLYSSGLLLEFDPGGGDADGAGPGALARLAVFAAGRAQNAAAARAAPPPGPAPPPAALDAAAGALRLPAGGRAALGDTPQDVLAELGAPEGVWRPAAAAAAPSAGGFWWNYFSLGLDVFFSYAPRGGGSSSGATAALQATRLVLHANAPGHPLFGRYARCLFVVLRAEDAAAADDFESEAFAGGGGSGGEKEEEEEEEEVEEEEGVSGGGGSEGAPEAAPRAWSGLAALAALRVAGGGGGEAGGSPGGLAAREARAPGAAGADGWSDDLSEIVAAAAAGGGGALGAQTSGGSSPRSFGAAGAAACASPSSPPGSYLGVEAAPSAAGAAPRSRGAQAPAARRRRGAAGAAGGRPAAALPAADIGVGDGLAALEAAFAAFGPLPRPAAHPSAPSRLFGLPGLVFEVMPDDSFASLTLFRL